MTTPELTTGLPLLRELLLFCAVAGILIPLGRKLHFSQVLAFLIVGATIGPFGLGSLVGNGSLLRHLTITDLEGTRHIAEFGVVFLLFTLGLEMSVGNLWSMRRWVFGLGNTQILVTAGVIALVSNTFGNSWAASSVLGLALALSSTAIVMQLLAERRELGSPVGRASFAILLMQDLMVVPLLVLVDNVGGNGETAVGVALLVAAAKAVAAIGIITLVGKRIAQPLFHRVSASHQPDAFTALTLLVTLGTAAATWAAGLSLALGAFLAGLLLAETAYRHQVQLTIEPFKGLFIGLFFLSVGMGIDLRALREQPLWIPLSVLGLFTIKSVIASLAMRGFGLRWPTAVEGGLLLGQGGEFAFIVIGIALTKGLLSPEVGQFMLIVVGFSMLAAPLVAKVGVALGRTLAPEAHPTPSTDQLPSMSGHVVIAGYGRVGQLLGEILDREGVPYLAIDRDVQRVAALHASGAPVYYGDAEHPDLLPGGIAEAAIAVVITLDEPAAAIGIAHSLQRHLPGLPVLARARDEIHAAQLLDAGVEHVVPETLEAALQLSGHVLEAIGYTVEDAHQRVQMMRETRVADLHGTGLRTPG
jgi:CPA2 family monovalent cation:H+ antiporter-2